MTAPSTQVVTAHGRERPHVPHIVRQLRHDVPRRGGILARRRTSASGPLDRCAVPCRRARPIPGRPATAAGLANAGRSCFPAAGTAAITGLVVRAVIAAD
jgi:hypothetical protein